MTDKKINWDQFYLPNVPLYRCKLPQEIIDRLWDYVKKAKTSLNKGLAGNISESLSLVDEDNFFMKNVIFPVCEKYCNYGIKVLNSQVDADFRSLKLSSFWVNYQNQTEFNPLHNHSGIVSFVIWLKIPTDFTEQHNLPFVKHSNTPAASDFQFVYSDMLGRIQESRVAMNEDMEGVIVVFPSGLNHQVYPFYNCDEQRISISGNVSLEAKL